MHDLGSAPEPTARLPRRHPGLQRGSNSKPDDRPRESPRCKNNPLHPPRAQPYPLLPFDHHQVGAAPCGRPSPHPNRPVAPTTQVETIDLRRNPFLRWRQSTLPSPEGALSSQPGDSPPGGATQPCLSHPPTGVKRIYAFTSNYFRCPPFHQELPRISGDLPRFVPIPTPMPRFPATPHPPVLCLREALLCEPLVFNLGKWTISRMHAGETAVRPPLPVYTFRRPGARRAFIWQTSGFIPACRHRTGVPVRNEVE